MNLLLITSCFLLFALIDAQREWPKRPEKPERPERPKRPERSERLDKLKQIFKQDKRGKPARWSSAMQSVAEKVKEWNRNNPCRPNPCNDGWCKRTGRDEFKCVCKHGRGGRDCSETSVCSSDPCMNKGRCISVSASEYSCKCRPGFTGDNCENKNICFPNPCKNRGVCTPAPSSENGFSCQCKGGFSSGQFCENVDWNARLTDYQDRLDDKVSRIASQYERDATVKMYALIGKERAVCIKDICMSDTTCDRQDLAPIGRSMNGRFKRYKVCELQVKQRAVCSLPMEEGSCDGTFGRYYYDSETSECSKFTYQGCGGNKNNFGSLEECQKTCGNVAAFSAEFDEDDALDYCLTEFMATVPDFTELNNTNCRDCIMENCLPDEEFGDDQEEEE